MEDQAKALRDNRRTKVKGDLTLHFTKTSTAIQRNADYGEVAIFVCCLLEYADFVENVVSPDSFKEVSNLLLDKYFEKCESDYDKSISASTDFTD